MRLEGAPMRAHICPCPNASLALHPRTTSWARSPVSHAATKNAVPTFQLNTGRSIMIVMSTEPSISGTRRRFRDIWDCLTWLHLEGSACCLICICNPLRTRKVNMRKPSGTWRLLVTHMILCMCKECFCLDSSFSKTTFSIKKLHFLINYIAPYQRIGNPEKGCEVGKDE